MFFVTGIEGAFFILEATFLAFALAAGKDFSGDFFTADFAVDFTLSFAFAAEGFATGLLVFFTAFFDTEDFVVFLGIALGLAFTAVIFFFCSGALVLATALGAAFAIFFG